MMNYKGLLCLGLALNIYAVAATLSAECIPGAADPCAPTKKIGNGITA